MSEIIKIENLEALSNYINNQLKPLGVDQIFIEYSGSGDSGGFSDFSIMAGENKIIGIPPATTEVEMVGKSKDGVLQTFTVEKSIDPRSWLESVQSILITAFGHGGFEDGDGGEGVFIITFVDGGIHVKNEHTYFAHDDVEESYPIKASDLGPTERNFSDFLEEMKSRGIEKVSVSYGGSSDSGEVYDAEIVLPENAQDLNLEGDFSMKWIYENGNSSSGLSFKQALTQLAEEIVSSKFYAWEDGDGANGTVDISSDGSIVLNHTTYEANNDQSEVEKTIMFA